MNAHSDCYGGLFPDFTRLRFKQKQESKAFSALIASSGTGPDGRSLEVKRDAWEECTACPDYRTCYDLSMAKLQMNYMLMNTMLQNPWVGIGSQINEKDSNDHTN
jgi:hypothetical protein